MIRPEIVPARDEVRLPRIVVGAAASGQGKTTVAVGLMAALSRSGLRVCPGKVGPDYIDPGYHALATGQPGRNLDPWMVGEDQITPLLLHAASTPEPADIAVIEGVMGLFDGQLGTDGFSSTAHVASLTGSPVILVIDTSSTSRTLGATVLGLKSYVPGLDVAAVILNKVGSSRHEAEVRRAIEPVGIPVLGALPRDAGISSPSRHLGLVPVAERPESASQLNRLAEQIAEYVDLDAVIQVAGSAPALTGESWIVPPPAGQRQVVAVAGGRAFTFRYAETDELLRGFGCEPVVFDPAVDTELPAGTQGLYLGGGFPEMHAASLETNRKLLAEIREAVASGMPTIAECAGLLYLCEAVDDHAFVGAVPAKAGMHSRLTLGYREAVLGADSVLGPAGLKVRGHEFHRTRTDPAAGQSPAWRIGDTPAGFSLDPAGTGRGTVHASYLHVHWAGHRELAESFAAAVRDFAPRADHSSRRPDPVPVVENTLDELDDPLLHHGDAEITADLANFAVNVRLDQPPAWLRQTINQATATLGGYPNPSRAREALARYHKVRPEQVLPTAGAAEAFTLIAQALPGEVTIIHPQFTEPEAAMQRAGRTVRRHVLPSAIPDGFQLTASEVPASGIIMIGNPTNPTGVLHPAAELRRLQGEILIVDEAFMDAVPGEPESLIGTDLTGTLVIRSLTKTWGIAGLRAGYVVGDPDLIGKLAAAQTPWSVGSPALAAMEAIATPAARKETAEAARLFTIWRRHLTAGLANLGLAVVDSAAPFMLVRVGQGVHQQLRGRGFAVRRADTFPGLDDSWVRIALRDPHTADGLLRELKTILKEKNDR